MRKLPAASPKLSSCSPLCPPPSTRMSPCTTHSVASSRGPSSPCRNKSSDHIMALGGGPACAFPVLGLMRGSRESTHTAVRSPPPIPPQTTSCSPFTTTAAARDRSCGRSGSWIHSAHKLCPCVWCSHAVGTMSLSTSSPPMRRSPRPSQLAAAWRSSGPGAPGSSSSCMNSHSTSDSAVGGPGAPSAGGARS